MAETRRLEVDILLQHAAGRCELLPYVRSNIQAIVSDHSTSPVQHFRWAVCTTQKSWLQIEKGGTNPRRSRLGSSWKSFPRNLTVYCTVWLAVYCSSFFLRTFFNTGVIKL
jgi:hypothetical protein